MKCGRPNSRKDGQKLEERRRITTNNRMEGRTARWERRV
jgi:hypothetical protein